MSNHPMNVASVLFLMLLTGFAGNVNASSDVGVSLESGSGLLGMGTADPTGLAQYTIGAFGVAGQREYFLNNGASRFSKIEETVGIFAIPFHVGVTRRLELNAGLYGYHAARPLKDTRNIYRYYGDSQTGIGAIRLGLKYLLTQNPSRFALAFKMDFVGGASSNQLDGLNYRWSRTDLDTEMSLFERITLGQGVTAHLEQGIVLSGSSLYDNQLVLGAGVEYIPHRIVSLGMVLHNRTFMGVSPQTLIQSVYDPFAYWDDTARIGDAEYIDDSEWNFTRDHLVLVPSVTVSPHERVSVHAGLVLNIADRDGPLEDLQAVVGVTFRGLMYFADTDDDGVPNRYDREPDTPAGYPVDRRGIMLDTDGDGVPDGRDRQIMTPKGAIIDKQGVGIDSDRDGVLDGIDMEPNSPPGCLVDAFGVSVDHDKDGVPDCLDAEPDTPPGCPVDEFGIAIDTDEDGIPDCMEKKE